MSTVSLSLFPPPLPLLITLIRVSPGCDAKDANSAARNDAGICATNGEVRVSLKCVSINAKTPAPPAFSLSAAKKTASAADASLALWALAWQPSNRRHMRDGEVVFPLIVLYREGSRLAADDAGAVLGVLARMDKDCASLINNVPIVGPSLLKHLTQKDSAERSESPNARERASQRRFTFANGGDGENGDGANENVNGDSAASPNIRGTISGNHVAAAVARASPK